MVAEAADDPMVDWSAVEAAKSTCEQGGTACGTQEESETESEMTAAGRLDFTSPPPVMNEEYNPFVCVGKVIRWYFTHPDTIIEDPQSSSTGQAPASFHNTAGWKVVPGSSSA